MLVMLFHREEEGCYLLLGRVKSLKAAVLGDPSGTHDTPPSRLVCAGFEEAGLLCPELPGAQATSMRFGVTSATPRGAQGAMWCQELKLSILSLCSTMSVPAGMPQSPCPGSPLTERHPYFLATLGCTICLSEPAWSTPAVSSEGWQLKVTLWPS